MWWKTGSNNLSKKMFSQACYWCTSKNKSVCFQLAFYVLIKNILKYTQFVLTSILDWDILKEIKLFLSYGESS